MHIAINKTVRPLIVPKPLPSRNNVPQFEAVRLMPGSNEVDEETVKVMRDSATVQFWIAKDWVALSTPAKEDEGLGGFEVAQALTFVSECMDTETLDRWLEAEKRKEVKQALKARQKELSRAINQDTRASA